MLLRLNEYYRLLDTSKRMTESLKSSDKILVIGGRRALRKQIGYMYLRAISEMDNHSIARKSIKPLETYLASCSWIVRELL